MKQREHWVDLTKGILTSLVVLGHTILGINAKGIPGHTLSHTLLAIHTALLTFRMPLFFMISGYLATQKEPLSTFDEYKTLLLKRLIRLGIPYLLFSLLEGVLRIVFSGYTNRPLHWESLLMIPIQPIDHLWFLYSLIAVFTFVPLLEVLLKNNRLVALILFGLYCLSDAIHIQWPFMILAFSNGLFFYAGVYLKRHWAKLPNRPLLLLYCGLPYIIYKTVFFGHEPNFSHQLLFLEFSYLVLSISGAMLCIYFSYFILGKFRIARSLLTFIGFYSFEIYLMHVPALATVRIALIKFFHAKDTFIHLGLGMTAGVLAPPAIAVWVKKLPVLEFMFYPGKYIKNFSFRKQPVASVQSIPTAAV